MSTCRPSAPLHREDASLPRKLPSSSILMIEDDARLALMLADYLSERGLTIVHVMSGEAGLLELGKRAFDVVVLDVMLPGRDGFSVCRAIRERWDVPILLVSARGEESQRIAGLELGADDYVVKPFSPRELLARINAYTRHRRLAGTELDRELRVGAFVADRRAMTATLDGEPLPLAPSELQLLVALMERAGQVISRAQLFALVGGKGDDAFDRSVDVLVSRLRRKLGEDRGRRLIRTIRGLGYMLVAHPSTAFSGR